MTYKTLSAGRFTDVNVDTSNVLGKGAEAIVYKAFVGKKIHAAKIFHDTHKVDVKKIQAMIANPPTNLTGETAGIEYPRYAWPTSIVLDSANQPKGFLMPLIDLAESFTLDHYYDKNLIPKLKAPDEVALSYKIEIAANLSALIADLHRHEHYFIDFKPQNIRVFKRTHAVTLVDCDGFSIGSAQGIRYPGQLLSTDYISPEAFRDHASAKDLGVDQDKYALAVIIFQLLNAGIHPFQGIMADYDSSANTNDEKAAAGLYPHGLTPNPKIKPRPQSIHSCFDGQTRVMFDRAFIAPPEQRPSAEEWATHLQSILSNKMLGRCDVHPYDIRHMHLAGKPCPACFLSAVEKKGAIVVPNTVIDKAKLHVPEAAAPAYVPVPASPSKPGNLNWLWWVAAVIVVSVIANISKESGHPSSQPAPPVVTPAPTVTPEQLAADAATQRSERVKKLFAAKDYFGVIKEADSGQYLASELNIIGISLYVNNEFARAIPVFQQAENAFPNESIVKRNLGDALFANGLSIQALEKYRAALAKDPSDRLCQQRVTEAERAVALLYQSVHKEDANIHWDNERYGVPLENESNFGTQKRQESGRIADEKIREDGRQKMRTATTEKSNFEAMINAAAQGDAIAQYNLGVKYDKGEVVAKDAAKAVEWWQKAAVQGYALAQFNLGSMYYNGEGVPKDASKAIEWWQKAAMQGVARAQFTLGTMYDKGEGIPKDAAKAVEWYQKAAAQGDANAQHSLGAKYDKGEGAPTGAANTNKEQVERQRVEREKREKEKTPSSPITEEQRLENEKEWLEREKENYRTRSF